jgi:hypothetical protein
MCLADGATQALGGLRDNDQVNMIGHQAICPNRDLLCAAKLRHELEVVLVAYRIRKLIDPEGWAGAVERCLRNANAATSRGLSGSSRRED